MEQEMSIIRIKKRENPYVQIDKRPLSDNRLSWRAKGLWCYLLSKPDDWEIRSEDVLKHGTEGRDAVRAAMAELKQFGYAELLFDRNKETGKTSGNYWHVYEEPIGLTNHRPDFPSDGKTPPSNNKSERKNKNKKEEESLPLPFASSEFEEAWKEWEQHRKELKAKLTLSTKRKQFKAFLQWGEQKSIEAIHTSISRGWTGCFSVPEKKSPADGINVPQPRKEEPEEKPETPQWKFRLDRMLKEVTDENASPLHMAWFNAMPAVGRQEWLKKATTGQLEALNNALRNAYNALYHV